MTRLDEVLNLHQEIERCRRCPLWKTRRNAVPGEGSAAAKVMFVGEAPGAREDESGRPFVGRSGDLLTELLAEIGFSRNDVFITSVLKSRPPKNRPPTKFEIDACYPYLQKQFELIAPSVIVLLGSVAVLAVIGPWKMSDCHGRFHEGAGRIFFMTYHPAAALRFPEVREVMRADFAVLRTHLDQVAVISASTDSQS